MFQVVISAMVKSVQSTGSFDTKEQAEAWIRAAKTVLPEDEFFFDVQEVPRD